MARRAATSVEAVVDGVLTEYAASYLLAIQQRSNPERTRVTWSSGNDVMVELQRDDTGAIRLLVQEIGLLSPLRKRLRSRRVKVEHILLHEPGLST